MTSKLGMRARMRLFAAALTAFTVLAIAVGLVRLHQLKDGMQTVYEDRVLPLAQLKAVSDAYAVKIVDMTHKAAHGSVAPAAALAEVRDARRIVAAEWRAYMATAMDAQERRLADAAARLMAVAEAPLAQLEGLLERADRGGLQQFAGQTMYPVMDPISDALAELVTLQQRVAADEYAAAQRNYRETVWLQGLLMLAALIVGALAARVIVRWLTRTLGGEPDHAARIAAGIASGRLDLPIDVALAGGAEAAEASVLGAMRRMQQQLRHVIGEIAHASGSVAAASRQIAVGNQDLSARTEHQSANLQQTAATMDRMVGTVEDGAAVAGRARELAAAVQHMAEDSAAAVARVVATMDGIQSASRRIADINAVIDGIAFQTNLLALNAAVEAARAGEQGRGFAVVAGEVRSLARRAGEAARQINGLIAHSVEQVETGSGEVGAAGTRMGRLAAEVRAVGQLINELSATTRHTRGGFGEINAAMVELDRHTQQNTALVEESAAAAQSLSAQAQRLRDTVAFFRLP